MLFEADYAKNYASILYQCLGCTPFEAVCAGQCYTVIRPWKLWNTLFGF